MANGLMYKSEAEKYLYENGWKLFLDKIIREKIVVFADEIVKVIDIVDEAKVEIRRHGKVIYSEGAKHEATRTNEGLSSTG